MQATKLTTHSQHKERIALASVLPYLDIQDNYLIKKNGNFVAGFEIAPLNNMALSAEQYAELMRRLDNLLQQLDQNFNLQFSYDLDFHPYKADFVFGEDEALNFFKQRRHQYYTYYKYLTCRQRLYIDLNAGPAIRMPYNILMSSESIKQRLHAQHRRLVATCESRLKAVQSGFRTLGIGLKRMDGADLANAVFQDINLNPEPLPSPATGKALSTELAGQDYVVENGMVRIGQKYVAVLTLSLLPEMTRSHMLVGSVPMPYLHPLLHNLPFPHKVVLSLQNLDMERETSRLSRQLNFTRFIMNFSRNKEGRQSSVKHQELKELMHEIYHDHKKLATLTLNVIIADTDPARLQQKLSHATLAFSSIDKARPVQETLDVLPIFVSCLPGNSAENYHRLIVKTSNAAGFISLSNFDRGAQRGILMKNRNNEPVLFDYFDANLNSWNSIIIGPTGTGKSYLMQSMLLQMLEKGVKVFGLDVGGVGDTGGSYKKLFTLLNGRYIELNIDNPIPLNPFALVRDKLTPQKQLFLRAFVEKLILEREQKTLSKIEQAFLGKSIEKYFAEFKGERNLKTFVQFFEQEEDPDGYVDTRLLARKMYMYTHGEYSRFLCADEMVDIREDLVCFDLKGLETHPDLQGVIAIIITGLLWDLMEQHLTDQKIIFADELWKVLDDQGAIGQLVVELFRTSRKMGAGIVAISQSIDDIENSSYSTPIKDNALNHFILGHKPKQRDGLARAFGYRERDLELISGLQRGEFFLDRDGMVTVLRADMSVFEHYLFTSNRQENTRLEAKLAAHDQNLRKAITDLVRENPQDQDLAAYYLNP